MRPGCIASCAISLEELYRTFCLELYPSYDNEHKPVNLINIKSVKYMGVVLCRDRRMELANRLDCGHLTKTEKKVCVCVDRNLTRVLWQPS